MGQIVNDPTIWAMLHNPLTSDLANVQIGNAAKAIRAGLDQYLNGPIGAIPNDLGKIPAVAQGIPGFNGSAFDLVAGWVAPLTAGLADVGTRLAVLVAILVLLGFGLRRLL